MEDSDVLDASEPVQVNFDLHVWPGWYDGFDFQFPEEATLYIDFAIPEGAEGLVHVGKARWPVNQLPLELSGW